MWVDVDLGEKLARGVLSLRQVQSYDHQVKL